MNNKLMALFRNPLRALMSSAQKLRGIAGRMEALSRKPPEENFMAAEGLQQAAGRIRALADDPALLNDLEVTDPELLGVGAEAAVVGFNHEIAVRYQNPDDFRSTRPTPYTERFHLPQVIGVYDAEHSAELSEEIIPNFKNHPHFRFTSARNDPYLVTELFGALWKQGYFCYDLFTPHNLVRYENDGEAILFLNDPGGLRKLDAAGTDTLKNVALFVQLLEKGVYADSPLQEAFFHNAPDVMREALNVAYAYRDMQRDSRDPTEVEITKASAVWQQVRATFDAMLEDFSVDHNRWIKAQESLGFYHEPLHFQENALPDRHAAPKTTHTKRITAETMFPPPGVRV